MATLFKTRIIRIGNSQGIRIPKLLLQQIGLTDEVGLEAQAGQLVIRPLHVARQGWAKEFQAMAAGDDDHLLDEDALALTQWEASEWGW